MTGFVRVKQFLKEHDIDVFEFSVPTPTSETAAAALGCSAAEIAKSLLFLVNNSPVLVVTSGDMKVNSSRLKQASGLSGKVRLPAADEVERVTGFVPGGVCPFLLPSTLPVLVDRSLQRFAQIYPAAGNDRSGVALTYERLLALARGQEVDICMSLADDRAAC